MSMDDLCDELEKYFQEEEIGEHNRDDSSTAVHDTLQNKGFVQYHPFKQATGYNLSPNYSDSTRYSPPYSP